MEEEGFAVEFVLSLESRVAEKRTESRVSLRLCCGPDQTERSTHSFLALSSSLFALSSLFSNFAINCSSISLSLAPFPPSLFKFSSSRPSFSASERTVWRSERRALAVRRISFSLSWLARSASSREEMRARSWWQVSRSAVSWEVRASECCEKREKTSISW